VRKHWRILVIGALVSGAAILMIASQIDFVLLGEALRTANYWMLIPGALVAVLGLVARAQRWRVLLSGHLRYVPAFHILNISYLLNGLLPFRMGELARVWLARRNPDSVPYLKSAGTIVLERVLDLLTVVLFIVAGLLIADEKVPAELRGAALGSGVIALAAFALMLFMAARRDFAHKLLGFFNARLPFLRRFDLTTWLDHTLDGLKPLTRIGSLFNVLLWTAISWGFSLLSGYLLMFVFYPEGDVVATLLFIAAASFAVALPAIPGNVGPYEGSIIFALGALGYTATSIGFATATAFAFAVHFVNLAVNAVLGVIGFIAEGVSLEQISQGVQQLRDEEEQEEHIGETR
jgi:uncharacterized protein (TIRG00374 family)